MKIRNLNNSKGITLIALIITIIILVILAGITISSLAGENGLFEKIKLAIEKHKEAEAKEQAQLNEFYKQLGLENEPPENTPDTEAGTVVALEEGWGLETVNYYKTTDGTEVKNLTKVSTVYAVSVGNGDTVPVPKGFYYVGGTLDTGVVISDNSDDKYDGKTDKTAYAYTRNLKGNQFVWIPCSVNEYNKTDWRRQDSEWARTTPKSELTQIEKYGGFYVARYEAGLASTIPEFTEAQTRDSQLYNKEGVPQSKAGLAPWCLIDWTNLKLNAESMYNNNYVSSGLITGTQWDVMLNTLINRTDLESSDITEDSVTWGNYRNSTLTYTGRKATFNGSSLSVFGDEETATKTGDGTKILLTTGASSETEKYHIFDVAGNLIEWTEEITCYDNSGNNRMQRDSGYTLPSTNRLPGYRYGLGTHNKDVDMGFRVVLYIK